MSRVIDLSGPEGNAFAVMGLARNWGKQLKDINKSFNPDKIYAEFKKCKSYEDILDTFDAMFKDVVDYEFINDPRNGEGE